MLVSFASWCFLELVHWIQQEVYKTLPSGLGLHPVPWWWPLPVLAVAGVLAAVAIVRLPGHGGHIPYEGIKAGTAEPADLPGILLAALATLGLGLVLGPEAPLIALGAGLAILAVRQVKKDTPSQVTAVLAASAAFAAIATIFGSPVIGAIILIEAAGLGGPMLPLVLLPGLMSAGIGSVIFLGMGHWTGLSSSAYALSPFTLPHSPPLPPPTSAGRSCSRSPPHWPPSRSPISPAGRRVWSPGSRGARRWELDGVSCRSVASADYDRHRGASGAEHQVDVHLSPAVNGDADGCGGMVCQRAGHRRDDHLLGKAGRLRD